MSQVSKTFNKLSTFVISILFLSSVPVYALTYDCSKLTDDLMSGQAPSPLALICILARVINAFILFAGVVMVIMVAYSGIKLATSFGDTKGFAGARNTWTYIVIGSLIVIGVFALILIVANLLGINFTGPNSLVVEIEEFLINLLDVAQVENYLD